MSNVDRQQTILEILQGLNDLDSLKRLFWEELNYERENRSLSPRQWPESARQPLAEDPTLFATGGEDGAFHVVYCRLNSGKLSRGDERLIVNRLTREHPYALFVFSNRERNDWHFLNVKYDENAEKRRLLRRISVRTGEGLRTAAERLQMLDLEAISPDLFTLSPLTIQQRHDDAFDVEKVTKDFYREIANWYFWALKHATFPKDAPKEQDGRDHISVIRLITRLIFCWFIREKGLIPDVLFDESKLAEMLNGFAPGKTRNKDSVFYRAILQNLFFATLNTEMDQRGWRRADQNFMAHSLYRHKECFRDPKAGLEWFKDIPFLNGGLFECLDRDFGEGVKPRYLRVDGFSDRDDSRPTVPDFLFFGSEQDIDLSDDYGDKKFKKVRARGLIDTLNRYKFTIEENTPLDQEVALDPELCGKVFENLLAAYNPETGTTARKATGSFYTPREIVDYMVDESLIAYLKGKLEPRMDANGHESGGPTSVSAAAKKDATERVPPETDERLRQLLAYDSDIPAFSEAETETLIEAIDGIKALDPAVGSGAFPMGMLHKLVHVLGRLDPGNERWKAKQIAKLDDAVMREDAERIFRENYDDYGRKLYLIENCIYGVDIQPIAVQIAKMRFFISLIVDQKENPKAPNRGVRALPNLETKFVAANTLIGIEKPAQMMLRNPEIDKKEADLRKVREKHFTARTLKAKARCREDDKRLRSEIADLLRNDGWDNTTAKQLAAWDPYDQNAHADFFDPEWMFGINDGFSVVIGNPPYVRPHKLSAELKRALWARFDTFEKKADLYVCFIERAVKMLQQGGQLAFIVSNGILRLDSFEQIRAFLLSETNLGKIIDFDKDVFESATVKTCILILEHTLKDRNRVYVGSASAAEQIASLDLCPIQQRCFADNYKRIFDLSADASVDGLKAKIRNETQQLGDIFTLSFGLKTGDDDKFLSLKAETKQHHKLLRGENIGRYSAVHKGEYVWYVPDKMRLHRQTARPGTRERFEQPKVLVRDTGGGLMGTFDGDAYYVKDVLIITHANASDVVLKKLIGILNSTLLRFYYETSFPTLHVQRNELASLPIKPVILEDGLKGVDVLVTRILAAKKADPAADTSALEREIDEQVYKLYGLTAEEIAIVEGTTHGQEGEK